MLRSQSVVWVSVNLVLTCSGEGCTCSTCLSGGVLFHFVHIINMNIRSTCVFSKGFEEKRRFPFQTQLFYEETYNCNSFYNFALLFSFSPALLDCFYVSTLPLLAYNTTFFVIYFCYLALLSSPFLSLPVPHGHVHTHTHADTHTHTYTHTHTHTHTHAHTYTYTYSYA